MHLKDSKLTLNKVIALTCPPGMAFGDWVETLNAEEESRRAISFLNDPWKYGSEGWEQFAPPLNVPKEQIVAGAHSVDATVEAFERAVESRLQTKGPKGLPGRILLAMAGYGQPDGSRVNPSNSTIAAHLHISRATVNRLAKVAEEGGWLSLDPLRG